MAFRCVVRFIVIVDESKLCDGRGTTGRVSIVMAVTPGPLDGLFLAIFPWENPNIKAGCMADFVADFVVSP